MKTRNAFKISFQNWQLLLKAIITQVLVIALVIAISFAFFSSIVAEVIAIFNQFDLIGMVNEVITSLAEGHFDAQEFATMLVEQIQNLILAIEGLVTDMPIALAYIGMIVVLCIYRMMISTADITVVYSLNEYMISNSKRPFIWYYFKKFLENLRYTLLLFVIAFPLDLVVLFASIGFYLLLLVTFGWWTIIPAIIIGVFMYTLRQTMFAFWLPSIAVNDKGVVAGLKDGLSKIPGNFWKVFLHNFIIITAMTVVALISAYLLPTTLGAVLTILVSLLGFYIMKCFNMVRYFEANNLPYFTEKVNIAELSGTTKEKSAQN